MAAFLHMSNLAPSSQKARLLAVLEDTHKFTRRETMQEFISYYGEVSRNAWNYYFSLIIITDKTKEQLDYLTEQIHLTPSGDIIDKYTFIEPEKDTEDYQILRQTGQREMTFSEFEKYIRLT